MTLTLYGTAHSRAFRVLWAATELGLDVRHVPLEVGSPETDSDAFRALSPGGRIPVLVDDTDGFVLTESLAINLHLAREHGRCVDAPLQPSTPRGEALAWQWTLWAQGHLEPWVQRDARLAEMRARIGDAAAGEVGSALEILERHLAARDWLVEDRFTVADLNVASVLSPSRSEHVHLAPVPRVAGWLGRCRARPAVVAARERYLSR